VNCRKQFLGIALAFQLWAAGMPQDPATLPPPPDHDPFVGKWEAATKAKRKPLYTRTIARAGDMLISTSSGGGHGTFVQEHRYRCDGSFYPLLTGDKISCTHTALNRVEGETRTPNGARQYWVREVSSDGRQMTITSYRNKDRKKIASVEVLNRVK